MQYANLPVPSGQNHLLFPISPTAPSTPPPNFPHNHPPK